MHTYGCSRMTVSKAISTLNDAGLVERRKRGGTIVARRRSKSMVLDIPDLPAEIEQRGQVYRFHLLERLVRAPAKGNPDEALLAAVDGVFQVRGVHFADEQPLAFEDRLIGLAAVPWIADCDFRQQPPGSWLLQNIPWTEAESRLGARAARAQVASVLAVPPGTPCLTITRRTWRSDEHITFVKLHFVAGRYELVARFGAAQGMSRGAVSAERHG